MDPENAEQSQIDVEKPKKKMTPAQLANLEKMRRQRAIKAEARKLVEKDKAAAPAPSAPPAVPDIVPDVVKVSEDVRYIREYIAKKEAAKQAKQAARASVDISTHDEEQQKYTDYMRSLRYNLLR